MMDLHDPQYIGYIVGGVIVGTLLGGLTVYRMIKRAFPLNGNSVDGIKASLRELENRIKATYEGKLAVELELVRKETDKTYLTIKSYETGREMDAMRMKDYIRNTLDEHFALRDKRFGDRFSTVEGMIDRNKEVVSAKMDQFQKELMINREQDLMRHQEVLRKMTECFGAIKMDTT